MVNKTIDSSAIKEKFAFLVAKLHDAYLPIDYINLIMIQSPFFDCFENNDFEAFMSTSFETITKDIFNKEFYFDFSHDYINAYYWAGLQVMEIMMNLNIPFKRILLIMGLKEIVASYEVYHEMDTRQFIDRYLEVEKQKCLLKILRNKKRLSISQISFLTGIKKATLLSFDNSNQKLFATSITNLDKLAKLFNISIDIFKEKSSFIPYSLDILHSDVFKVILIRNILSYFNMDENAKIYVSNSFINNKKVRQILKENKYIIDLSDPYELVYISSNRVERKILSDNERIYLYQKSIDELKTTVSDLLF